MKSLADELPPEIANQIHPDWRKNEAAYWAFRDHLLGQYHGQWIGFADGESRSSVTARWPCSTRPRPRNGILLSPASGAKTSRHECAGLVLLTMAPIPASRYQS